MNTSREQFIFLKNFTLIIPASVFMFKIVGVFSIEVKVVFAEKFMFKNIDAIDMFERLSLNGIT